MTRLVEINLPAPRVIDPPSFEEYQVGEVSVIIAAEDGRVLLTEAGDPIAGPVFDVFETADNQIFFVRVAA